MDKEASLPQYSLRHASDTFWNSAIRTMVRPASFEWNNDQLRLAKFAVQSVRSVQELGIQQTHGEYVTRDLLGRHVRDMPRSTYLHQSRSNTRATMSSKEAQCIEQRQKILSDAQQHSKNVTANLKGNDQHEQHEKTPATQIQSSLRETQATAHTRFKFWSQQTRKARSNINHDKKSKLSKLSVLQWKGYRRENDCESDSLDSDNQTPYDSIRTTLNSEVAAEGDINNDIDNDDTRKDDTHKTGNTDVDQTEATGGNRKSANGDKRRFGRVSKTNLVDRLEQDYTSSEEAPRAYSRQISGRKVSLVRGATGESIGIISCESGPLPSWLEEAVWEVETTGSEILSC